MQVLTAQGAWEEQKLRLEWRAAGLGREALALVAALCPLWLLWLGMCAELAVGDVTALSC